MKKPYDFVVIGAGVFGAWTAYALRRGGKSVVLLDAYGPGNSRASSGGETRVIRLGYGPDELYTRFSAQSFPAWMEMEKRCGQKLFHKSGVLWLSHDSDLYTKQLLDVLKKNGASYAKLSAEEVRKNYPQLSFPDVTWGVLEPESGVLMARRGVQTVVSECVKDGVEFLCAAALSPSINGKLQAIRTTSGESISAEVFIFACGPWLPKVFPDLLGDRIHPTRQEVFFLGVPAGDSAFGPAKMPVWLHHTYPSRPYALPDIENRGFKIAFDRHGPDFDPDTGSRVVGEASISELRDYLKHHIPILRRAPIVETRVCQYENTFNGDLLIDRHPQAENVWLVGGGSGHGFKHGPAVGEYVKRQILDNAAAEPRFSLATKQTTRMRTVF
jgi:monomeric sarcosine oxidase